MLLNNCIVTGDGVATDVILSAIGNVKIFNSAVNNTGGGGSINANNGAAADPNVLHGVFVAGAVNFGAAVALVGYVVGALAAGAAVLFDAGDFIATGALGVVWAAVVPTNRTDAVNRIAAALATLLPPGGIA
jgi:hypothetical protein